MSLNCTRVTLIIYWSTSLFDIAINTQQMSCQSLLECTPSHPLQKKKSLGKKAQIQFREMWHTLQEGPIELSDPHNGGAPAVIQKDSAQVIF